MLLEPGKSLRFDKVEILGNFDKAVTEEMEALLERVKKGTGADKVETLSVLTFRV